MIPEPILPDYVNKQEHTQINADDKEQARMSGNDIEQEANYEDNNEIYRNSQPTQPPVNGIEVLPRVE